MLGFCSLIESLLSQFSRLRARVEDLAIFSVYDDSDTFNKWLSLLENCLDIFTAPIFSKCVCAWQSINSIPNSVEMFASLQADLEASVTRWNIDRQKHFSYC